DDLIWFQGNLANHASIAPLLDGVDAVVHLALARDDASFMASPADPIEYYRTNVFGTLALIEQAIDQGVKRMINVSSGAVHEHVYQDRPLDETHPLTPRSLYGAVKCATETMATSYGLAGQLDIANLRPVSIYGVEPIAKDSRFFGVVKAAAAGETVDISGGGKVVHVLDVARAIEHLLMTSETISGETYHCCDAMVTHAEIVEIVGEYLSRTVDTTGQRKADHHPITSQKLRDLGFQFGGTPRLRQTIAEMIALTSNPNGATSA
ncbi:MAG: SDR family oxidoreductase, partial [Planctomycetota bacterium]